MEFSKVSWIPYDFVECHQVSWNSIIKFRGIGRISYDFVIISWNFNVYVCDFVELYRVPYNFVRFHIIFVDFVDSCSFYANWSFSSHLKPFRHWIINVRYLNHSISLWKHLNKMHRVRFSDSWAGRLVQELVQCWNTTESDLKLAYLTPIKLKQTIKLMMKLYWQTCWMWWLSWYIQSWYIHYNFHCICKQSINRQTSNQ